MSDASTSAGHGLHAWRWPSGKMTGAFGVLAAAAAAVALLAAGTLAIHLRAPTEADAAAAASVAVETLVVERVEAVRRSERYVGRIEPARQTRLAFERGGTLVDIRADEGQVVREGETVARLDTALLEARRAELTAERAALEARAELASLTLRRRSELRDRGHVSEQAYDEARLSLTQTEAAIRQVDAGLRSVAIDLRKSVLRAPFSGQITARALDEGGIVSAGEPVLDIIESGRPQIRVGIPEDRATTLRAGQVLAVDAAGGRQPGRIAAIRADMDPATQTRIVVLDLPPDEALVFGAIAEVVIEDEIAQSGFWVPITALHEGARGLWTVITALETADGLTAASETVEIVVLDGGRALVRGTLTPGAEIVATGRHRLVPGTRIARADAS